MPNTNPRLLIFIHGDGILGGGPSDYLKYQATNFPNPDTISVILIRPGYYDSYGNYSKEKAMLLHAMDILAIPYREETVATLAAAIKSLKEFYQPRCTILVGHSGGAIMSGIILGKYPGLVDGAVLASVEGNIHEWTNRHKWADWPSSLSPSDWINKIPKNNFVYIVSGTKDDNTPQSWQKNTTLHYRR